MLLAAGVLLAPSLPAAQHVCGREGPPASNPCPAEDDLLLPMPGGLVMAFRAVPVPGPEFWGNAARNVEMGNPEAPIFEAPRLVTVAGSFPDPHAERWLIILGKYEVTVAQLAVVMGDGVLADGLARLARESGGGEPYARLMQTPPGSRAHERLLARPVTGLPQTLYRRFIERYTEWCYAQAACLEALPRHAGMPGFFRLPTEIEWEYAARDGGERFEAPIPFAAEEAKDFAAISTIERTRHEPTAIGRFRPVGGLYDLYGNVSELAEGRFTAELGQGKPGVWVARGGDYASTPMALRASMRTEIADFRRTADGYERMRPQRVGIRLAIGSQTVTDAQSYAAIVAEYEIYRSTARFETAAGKSTQAPLLQAGEPLARIDAITDELMRSLPAAGGRLKDIRARTEEARLVLQQTIEELTYQGVRNTMRAAAEAMRSYYQATRSRARAAIFEGRDAARQKAFEASAQDYVHDGHALAESYGGYVRSLASYRDFATLSLEDVEGQALTPRDEAALAMIRKHLSELATGGGDPRQWREDLEEMARTPDLYR